MKMQIILNFVDISEEASNVLVEWLREVIGDKSPHNLSPLRYVDTFRVEQKEGWRPK